MKRNGAVKTYLPIPQTQSDDEESTQVSGADGDKTQSGLISTTPTEDGKLFSKPVDNADDDSLSPMRKFLFVSSLALCVFSILLFLIIIPCKPENIVEIQHNVSEKIALIKEISITTNIQVVNDESKGPVLLFGFSSPQNQTFQEYGLLAINLTEKSEKWRIPLQTQPLYCQCGLAVDANRTYLCIVSKNGGSIIAIHPGNGSVQWSADIRNVNQTNVRTTFPPLFAPSCTKDSTCDVLLVYAEEESAGNQNEPNAKLALVSTSLGKMIGMPMAIPFCARQVSAVLLQKAFNGSTNIIVYCQDEAGIGNIWKMPTSTLCHSTGELATSPELTFEKILNLASTDKFLKMMTLEKDSGISDIVVVLDGTRVLLLDGNNYTQKWKISLPKLKSLSQAVVGKFLGEKKKGLLLVGETLDSQNMLFLIDPSNGTQVWSKSYNNGMTSASVNIVPHSGNEKDSILWKLSASKPTTLPSPDARRVSAKGYRPSRGLSLEQIMSESSKNGARGKMLHDSDFLGAFDQDDLADKLGRASSFIASNVNLQDERSLLPNRRALGVPEKSSLDRDRQSWQAFEHTDVYFDLSNSDSAEPRKIFSISSLQICSEGSCFPETVQSNYAILENKIGSSGYMVLVSSSSSINGTNEMAPAEQTLVQKVRLDAPHSHERARDCFW